MGDKKRKMVVSYGEEVGTTVEYLKEIRKLPKFDKEKHIEVDSIRDIKSNGKVEKTLVFKQKDGQAALSEEAKEEAGKYWVKNEKSLKKMGLSGFAFHFLIPKEMEEETLSFEEGLKELNTKLEKASRGELDDDDIEDMLDDADELIDELSDDIDTELSKEEDVSGWGDMSGLEKLSGRKDTKGFTEKNIHEGARMFKKLFRDKEGMSAAKRYRLLTKSLAAHVKLLARTPGTLSLRDLRMCMAGVSIATGMDTKEHRLLVLGTLLAISSDRLKEEEDDE